MNTTQTVQPKTRQGRGAKQKPETSNVADTVDSANYPLPPSTLVESLAHAVLHCDVFGKSVAVPVTSLSDPMEWDKLSAPIQAAVHQSLFRFISTKNSSLRTNRLIDYFSMDDIDEVFIGSGAIPAYLYDKHLFSVIQHFGEIPYLQTPMSLCSAPSLHYKSLCAILVQLEQAYQRRVCKTVSSRKTKTEYQYPTGEAITESDLRFGDALLSLPMVSTKTPPTHQSMSLISQFQQEVSATKGERLVDEINALCDAIIKCIPRQKHRAEKYLKTFVLGSFGFSKELVESNKCTYPTRNERMLRLKNAFMRCKRTTLAPAYSRFLATITESVVVNQSQMQELVNNEFGFEVNIQNVFDFYDCLGIEAPGIQRLSKFGHTRDTPLIRNTDQAWILPLMNEVGVMNRAVGAVQIDLLLSRLYRQGVQLPAYGDVVAMINSHQDFVALDADLGWYRFSRGVDVTPMETLLRKIFSAVLGPIHIDDIYQALLRPSESYKSRIVRYPIDLPPPHVVSAICARQTFIQPTYNGNFVRSAHLAVTDELNKSELALYRALMAHGGRATRSQMFKHVAESSKINKNTLTLAISQSVVFTQVDYGRYGVVGSRLEVSPSSVTN